MRVKFTILYTALALTATAGIGQEAFSVFKQDSQRHRNIHPLNSPALPPSDWEGPVIYGSINYTSDEDPSRYGIYALDAASGRIAPIYLDDHIDANGSGVYQNGVYRFVSNPSGQIETTYYEYSVPDWRMLKKETLPDMTNIALDEAYDPVTGNVYGCFSDARNTKFSFGYVDHDTHKMTPIADTDILYFGIVATPQGRVYGIGHDGKFYEIDKLTGRRTLVGPLGVMPKYNQTAVCDLHTGKIYWMGVATSGASGLYEINEKTGKATIIRSFSKREGFVGAFIAQEPWPGNVPAAPADLTVSCDKAAMSGTVTFSLPSTCVDGSPLSGKQKYKVLVNNEEIFSGEAETGAAVSVPFSVSNEAIVPVVAYVEGKDRPGKIARITPFIGNDAPEGISNLKATLSDGNNVTLSWDAPTKSLNDGYLDEANISYRIIRQPGNVTVSNGYKKTTFSQKLSDKEYHAYYYEVTPMSHSRLGHTSKTDYIIVGPAKTIPYDQPTTSLAGVSEMVMINEAWGFDQSADSLAFIGNSATGLNGLVTPYLSLDSSKAYKVEIHAAAYTGQTRLRVKAGQKPALEDMTLTASSEILPKGIETEVYETYIYAPKSGNWHIAFMGNTNDDLCALAIGNIAVTEATSALAPAKISDLQVTPGAKGEQKVDINFTVPAEAINGTPLSEISKIEIYRGYDLIGTIDNPAPGSKQNFTDDKAEIGEAAYTVRADNASGKGIPSEISVYVGEDIPVAPADLKIVEHKGLMTISWTAPDKGVRGAYVNPDELTYNVIRSDGALIGQNVKGTSIEDPELLTGYQRYVQYAVQAISKAGAGYYAISRNVIAGSPYDTPFYENFTEGGLDHPFWETGAVGNSVFRLNRATGCDGEIGYASYSPKAGDTMSSLTSGKISPEGVEALTLSYSYFAYPGEPTEVRVVLTDNEGNSFTADRVSMAEDKCDEGWRYRAVAIPQVTDAESFRLSFEVYTNGSLKGTAVDNIIVGPGTDRDLTVIHSSVGTIRTGETKPVYIMVTNNGSIPFGADDFIVKLYKNGVEIASMPGVLLTPGNSHTFEAQLSVDVFDKEVMKLQAEVILDDDQNPDDNLTAESITNVILSNYPAPRDFDGTLSENNEVSLKWNEPDLTGLKTITVTDDTEDYKPFAINHFGDWKVIDVDGAMTFGIGDGAGSYVAFPNALDPKAFMVFNPVEGGLSIENEFGQPTKWMPHSGEQCLISFQASSVITDDWLISPRLSGKAQTISFFAKSAESSSGTLAQFEIYYSKGGTTTDDFYPVKMENNAPFTWTEFRFDIPEGAQYFAIRVSGTDFFAFMVDDITYSPEDLTGAKLEGYNVYRNRQLLNEKPVSAREYKETLKDKGGIYAVTARYDNGESQPTVEIHLGETGMSAVTESGITFETHDGILTINGAKGLLCSIYTIDGINIFVTESLEASASVKIGNGIFIVHIDENIYKIHIH